MCGSNPNRFRAAIRTLLAAGLGLLGSTFAGCGREHPAAAKKESVLRISQRNEPATLDPQLASLPDEFFILRSLAEGLVVPDPAGGTPKPAAATRWENSSDGLTWTFHLRPGARWSDGEPVTAGDFVFAIRRALTAATAAPKASLFFVLRGAEEFYRNGSGDIGAVAPDDATLVLTLRRARGDFLDIVASGPWLPVQRKVVEAAGKSWTRPGTFVGNGRFRLEEWEPNHRLRVRKNPHHWDATHTRLEAVEFRAFDNGDTEERAFRAGQIDVTLAVPATKIETYRTKEPGVLQVTPLYETRFLAVNTQRPPLDDVRVRRALSLALDRTALVEKVLKAGQRPALSYVPPGLGHYQPDARLLEDAAEAKRLLAAAGFPDGHNFPALELSAWAVSVAQLEAIQERWREQLGIRVAIVQREARTHLAALARGDFDLGFMTAIPDYNSPADLLERCTSANVGNFSQWRDPDFDRAVDAQDYRGAERRLLDAMPLIPVYINAKTFLLRPSVRGWQEDALWTRYYDDLELRLRPE